MSRYSVVLTAACLVLPLVASAQQASGRFEVPADQEGRWFKGNTHSHTSESDGDSPPEVVAQWYKSHGYQFLVLSDHNVFTDPRTLAHLVDSTFLLIPGEELTSSFEQKPVHVNGLNLPGLVEAQTDTTLVGTIQKNVDAIRDVQGVPHINHPNFLWSLSADELAQVRDNKLFEIFNGHSSANNLGGGGVSGLEEAWDQILGRGVLLYGLAVDDAHDFKASENPDASRPGRGWIHVRAPRLAAADLLAAIDWALKVPEQDRPQSVSEFRDALGF